MDAAYTPFAICVDGDIYALGDYAFAIFIIYML